MTEHLRDSWFVWPFRLGASLAAVLLCDQAVFAGQFLSGTFGSLHTHRENATVAGVSVLVTAVFAALLRWPGRGPIWPLFACLGLFAAIAAQIAAGFARVLALHVPLGVLIIMVGVHLAVWSWRYRPAVPARAAAGAEVRS